MWQSLSERTRSALVCRLTEDCKRRKLGSMGLHLVTKARTLHAKDHACLRKLSDRLDFFFKPSSYS